jgi:hypothetical protein
MPVRAMSRSRHAGARGKVQARAVGTERIVYQQVLLMA